jgi:thiol:disulfide interchange protein
MRKTTNYKVDCSKLIKHSQTHRRVPAGIGIACVAVCAYVLWLVALHFMAQAILESRELKPSGRAPDFTLNDAKGGRLRLADYRGKVVLLNFWATWCGPCKTEIRELSAEMHRRDRKVSKTAFMLSLSGHNRQAVSL